MSIEFSKIIIITGLIKIFDIFFKYCGIESNKAYVISTISTIVFMFILDLLFHDKPFKKED